MSIFYKALPSILPTTKLYDRLYVDADVRIPFRDVPDPAVKDLRADVKKSNEYQILVNEAIQRAVKASGLNDALRSVGTPSKIWAIDERMETWHRNDGRLYICGINYGFHQGNPTLIAPKQTAGAAHEEVYKDYSQIVSFVAGWCLVMGPNENNYSWRSTADVYLSAELSPLVTPNGKPTPQIRYTGHGRGPKPR